MTETALRPAPEAPSGAEPFFASDEAFPLCSDMRNLHRVAADQYREANAVALKCGGRNPHGGPNYRVVWGWEDPYLYVGRAREFFYLQRWLPPDLIASEEAWAQQEKQREYDRPDLYIPNPYPRHGDYFTVRKCQWARQMGSRRIGVFRWPNALWVENAIINNRIDMGRTPGEIRLDVAAKIVDAERKVRQELHRIEDEHDIRNVRETMTQMMIRNPSLRKEPEFLLSPATSAQR